jgi:lysosomal acid phosphatase
MISLQCIQPIDTRTTANYASALAFELRRGPAPEDRDFIRIKFKNGTNGDFETYHAFGHKSDIAATEFIYRIEVGTRASF